MPPEERHGVAWHQGPFWFTGGFVLPSMLTDAGRAMAEALIATGEACAWMDDLLQVEVI